MSRISPALAPAVVATLLAAPAEALVHYDEGRVAVDGVQLLQTVEDPNAYQYLAGGLTLALRPDGAPELLIAKVVGEGSEATGGILHALVEFGLPESRRAEIESLLQERRPGARVVGPVPMVASLGEDGAGADAEGSFQVVSAILSEDADPGDRISGQVVTSGTAPFAPGSKAALAARLSPEAATLMWDSLTGETADLSVAVRGYYEAQVEGYNAVVEAEKEVVYAHESFVSSQQQGYSKRQLRDITDELIEDGAIRVEVFDRSLGDEIDTEDMETIVDLVSDKLIELYFDRQTGWSRPPEPEEAVEQGQICGRQERGFFSKLFSGATDDPYCTDDQYVIKDIEDVRRASFRMNLSKRSTVMVPFDTAGNLGGFYDALEEAERERHFKIIPLDDPARETIEVTFQLDSAIVPAFGDRINLATVNLKRRRADGSVQTDAVVFDPQMVEAGTTKQEVTFHRLGDPTEAWREFDYQVAWAVSGLEEPLRTPEAPEAFLSSSDAGIQLTPPLERATVALDVNNLDFEEKEISALVLSVASRIGGRIRPLARTIVRASDAEPYHELAILRDRGAPTVVRRTWHTRRGVFTEPLQLVRDDFHSVFAPEAEWFAEQAQVEGGR